MVNDLVLDIDVHVRDIKGENSARGIDFHFGSHRQILEERLGHASQDFGSCDPSAVCRNAAGEIRNYSLYEYGGDPGSGVFSRYAGCDRECHRSRRDRMEEPRFVRFWKRFRS